MTEGPIVRPGRWKQPDPEPEPGVVSRGAPPPARVQPENSPRRSLAPLMVGGLFFGLVLAVGIGFAAMKAGWIPGLAGPKPEAAGDATASGGAEVEEPDSNDQPDENGNPERGDSQASEDDPPAVEEDDSDPPIDTAPPAPKFDSVAVTQSSRRIETEVLRAEGYLQDIRDGERDRRMFHSVGGMEDAISSVDTAIEKARLLRAQCHERAAHELALIMATARDFPRETERLVREQKQSAKEDYRINAHRAVEVALRRLPLKSEDDLASAKQHLLSLFTLP